MLYQCYKYIKDIGFTVVLVLVLPTDGDGNVDRIWTCVQQVYRATLS